MGRAAWHPVPVEIRPHIGAAMAAGFSDEVGLDIRQRPLAA
jgi:hypothetical protein